MSFSSADVDALNVKLRVSEGKVKALENELKVVETRLADQIKKTTGANSSIILLSLSQSLNTVP